MGSVTDNPINSISEDLLQIENYAKALSNFIINSDTPITIGLQGEWGTGKTSLMSMIQELLQKNNIATSWVNTWEYSMFRRPHETTPKILHGMLDRLQVSCKEKGFWDVGDEVSQSVKKVGRFLGNLANQVVLTKTGFDLAHASANQVDPHDIAIIKSEIAFIINRLIESPGNPFSKIVFFIDDLDRIPPLDAVEVLEALKNIFDIPNCIFVLAVDYDIVVKGLEGKFGRKTELNEREFRSFFDKIIQVPFSMPVGAYSIEGFLSSKMKHIHIEIDAKDRDHYLDVVKYTVGSNPRSLKRYLNSFSLIKNVIKTIQSPDELADDLMLFAILGIQISYPQIFRLITQDSEYLNWDKGFLNRQHVDWKDVQNKISLFKDNKLLDEEWEQVVWGCCQKEVYLRARSFDVLQLLNLLRDRFDDNLHDKLERAIVFAAMTNVDGNLEKQQIQGDVNKRVKFGSLDAKLNQLRELGYHEDNILAYKTLVAPLSDKVKEGNRYRLSLARSGGSFNDDTLTVSDRQQIYFHNPRKRLLGIQLHISQTTGLVDELFEYINNLTGAVNPDYTSIHNPTPEDRYQTRSLVIKPALAERLSKDKYHQMLHNIATRVIQACDNRTSI